MANKTSPDSQLNEAAELLLTPIASLFGFIARKRSDFYASGFLSSTEVGVPVVSIGNLTAGGTGKTPITAWLVGELKKQGLTCGIVSRGYGGEEKGPIRVVTTGVKDAAKRFGDEPSWLASVYPDVPVVIGGDRVADVRELLSQEKVQVILADDAFQHRKLRRDLDIVVIDATEPRWHYRPLPLGRMREGFSALSRAKYVFLSKTNQADQEQLEWIRGLLRELRTEFAFTLIEFESTLSGFVRLAENLPSNVGEPNPFTDRRAPRGVGETTDPQFELSKPKGNRLVVMTAIGRPHVFKSMIESQTGLDVAESIEFRDHHAFSQQELADVEAKAVSLKARAIVVTEKDATKLRGWSPKIGCYVSRLTSQPNIQFSTEVQELYEAIGRLTR